MQLDVPRLRQRMEELGITQVDLARRSGVSRTRLNAILNQDEPEVHTGTVMRIAKALGLPEEKLERHGIERAYLEAVDREHQNLDFSGLGIVTADGPSAMGQVFASVRVRERPADDSSGTTECDHKQPPVRSRPQKLAAALATRGRFFLLGDPGAGKTTSLRHLAGLYANESQAEFSSPSERLVPVFIRLSDWAEQIRNDGKIDLLDAALNQLRVPDPAETLVWLRVKASAGKLFLLLDGLDEVPDPELKGRLTEGIRSFLEAYRENRVIISSRVVGFETPSLGVRFDTLALEPLSIRAVRGFAHAWCSFRHGHKSSRACRECDRRMEALRHAIIDNPRIRILATNPMMLTILLLLQEAGAALPQRRWDLYEKLSEAFLFSWQEKKRTAISGSPDSSLKLEDRELVWVLESLGLQMQLADRTLVPRWWLTEHLRGFLEQELLMNRQQAGPATDALIWSLQERSGLLAERGPERYGFQHLAFQEYFAARAVLASDDPIASIRPFIYHPRWHEVVRLVAAQMDRRRSPQLLRAILDDPDPAGRVIGRGLLTALGCLADGAPLNDPKLRVQLLEMVIDLGRTRWLGVSLEALDLLADLRSTRLEEFAEDAAERMLQAAREALSPEEQSLLLLRAADIERRRSGEQDDDTDAAEDPTAGKPLVEVKFVEDAAPLLLFFRPAAFDSDWAKQVVGRLFTDDSVRVRAICAAELGRFVKTRPALQSDLLKAMASEKAPQVRSAIVRALGRASATANVRFKLLHYLDADPDAKVRGVCAAALRMEAERHPQIRQKFASLVLSEVEPDIRAGAALGLSSCVSDDNETREILVQILFDATEDESVRVGCLWALEGVIPGLPGALGRLSRLVCESPADRLAGVAARLLAQYATDGRTRLEELPVEAIEQRLMSVREPCRHYLDALRGLVDARELRRLGVPREERIKAALSEVLPRIQTMFIFGSAARGDQSAESDIDLMVIGQVPLRELTPGLKRAEQELGRQVNAVVYSPEEWTKRYRDRNAFVTQVMKAEKIFIVGAYDELAAMA